MTTHITKTWFDGEKVVTKEIPESDIYKQDPMAWKLVPIKPTDEMLKAMDECSKEGYDERLYAGHAASVYMAAVDAAPIPPAEQDQTSCACRWDSEGDRVVTCARHEGWLEVVVEWADRAREAEKKLKSLAQPVLQDIEQYRMQMNGICTAAIGYWKEGDNIHPDYNTLALRDVAKLYAKYDALYNAQDVSHAMIAGALFDFMGWLTTRDERLVLSSADEAGPAVDAIRDFAKIRGLSLDDAMVQDWQDIIKERT